MVALIVMIFGFLYGIYSFIGVAIKVKKAGKSNCVFRPSWEKEIFRVGVSVLLIVASALYKSSENSGWMPFLGLSVCFFADFVEESIEIKE